MSSRSVALRQVVMATLIILSLAGSSLIVSPTQVNADSPACISSEDCLAQMNLAEKIGQMTQVNHSAVLANPEAIRDYFIGSLLSGGGAGPTGGPGGTASDWADMYDNYQSFALQTRLGIPLIYGVDAVHGHNNVVGATIFPHNIGLGATRDTDLVQEIEHLTALEVAGTGIDWTFAPVVAVPRNERWGRTYEGFGEIPELVGPMGAAAIKGFQGWPTDLSAPDTILATAKHYVGDGGTTDGRDQGNTEVDEQTLREIHLAPYIDAIEAGTGSVMISFSSWNGVKMHGNSYLINDVLKGELGFDGLVVSDWAGINQIPGNYNSDVRTSINAGIDLIMVPTNYTRFINTLNEEFAAGNVSMERIDDAVLRILKAKFDLDLFNHPYTDRSYTTTVGSAEHRAVARQAVRESLVLLKNEGILPLPKDLDQVFVGGKNADNLGYQMGGWTISWQGGSGDTTIGTTILEAIQDTVSADTTVNFSQTCEGVSGDAAIIIVGETSYAEGFGDRRPPFGTLDLAPEDIACIDNAVSSGIPTVVVLISGRPMIITDEIASVDGFVAAWYPGSEGQGVADMLFGYSNYTGKLPHTWPETMDQIPINFGDEVYDPLFPYGFGLSYQPYPIAVNVDTIAGAQIGQELPDILDGGGRGNFGWLTWTGEPSEVALANSLMPPGDSDSYTNPDDPDDHVLSAGDWVYGSPGIMNADATRLALEELKEGVITVPVWDTVSGEGSTLMYHVVGFARIQITGFNLPRNQVSAIYQGGVVWSALLGE